MDSTQFWIGVVAGFIVQSIVMALFWNFIIDKMKRASMESMAYQENYKQDHDPANWWKNGKSKDKFGRDSLN